MKSKHRREIKRLHRALGGWIVRSTNNATERDEALRRLAWVRTQVEQWRDNEDTKGLPPMKREEAVYQIKKSEHKRDAFNLVLEMFDVPIPPLFGRGDADDDE